MSLQIGTQLGSVQILALLGRGGMGEVYRARDLKLKREVAIKILPDELSRDPDRVARFQREAEVLASLNHPSIAAIYNLEEANGLRFLVLELVEGETLAERIKRGPIPIDEALNIAKNICEALEAAHEKSVVHRDLKPANVKITPEGKVKVLDFGLAKVREAEQTNAPLSNSPTLLSGSTPGMIIGTAAYMSPEQAKGKNADRTSDVWAFGCVLYEMLTGRAAFDGEDVTEILAHVLTREPDWTRLPGNVSPRIQDLLQLCLEKNIKNRRSCASDVRLDIEQTLKPAGVRIAALSLSRLSLVAWKIVAAMTTVVALGLGFLYFRQPAEQTRTFKLSLLPPEESTFATFSVSPDGRRLAFTANVNGRSGLWVRDLDSPNARSLPGTQDANRPFWSPDSRFVAFFAGGKLKKIDVSGGPVLTVCDAEDPRGGSWGRNDVIVFAPAFGERGLFRVTSSGGAATGVTELDPSLNENSHRFPWFLPDGRHFLFTARSPELEKTTIYVGDIESKTRRAVLAASSEAVYSPPGYLMFLRERTLMAQPFDADKAATGGEAVPIAEQVNYDNLNVFGAFSASQNGVLAYISGFTARREQLTWFDRSGRALGAVGAPGVVRGVAISPDGKTVAFARNDTQVGLFDVWLHDLARGTDSRFTFAPPSNDYPIWSPDGSHVAFASVRHPGCLFQRATRSAARDELLDSCGGNSYRPLDWSRDGRYIIEQQGFGKTREDIWVLPLFGDRKSFPYLQTESSEAGARLSPNGLWLAYVSDETKRNEVYVQSFPSPGSKLQVSINGGDRPVWSRDGKELFFIGADGKMIAVDVKSGLKFEAGVPKALFDTRLGDNSEYDVSNDGRFLIPTIVEQGAAVPMTVVINWSAALKK